MYQTTGLNRSTLDKYYTKPNVAEKCIKNFVDNIEISKEDIFIEPSAGSGVFIPYMKTLSKKKNLFFYDIMPEHKNIVKQDFLALDTTVLEGDNMFKIHIIGNPPFGRQSTLVKQFILKSVQFADTIAFILPRSFKKMSMQSIFPHNWHIMYQKDLGINSFTVNNKDLDVPSVFQIWYKNETKKRRIYKQLIPSDKFEFVRKNQSPNFSIRRIGFYAGEVYMDIEKNEESHFFIKVNNKKDVKDIIDTFRKLSFLHKNTVGPRSVSKQELLRKLPISMRLYKKKNHTVSDLK